MDSKKTIVQQSTIGGVDIAQGNSVVHLGDSDIARLIQVRFCLERMTWDDLIWALTLFQNSTGIRQVSLEQVMNNDIT